VSAEARRPLLGRPPEEAARVLALELLEAAAGAHARLGAQRAGDEALHDFRVGLRRLRSTLRSYRPWLGGSRARKLERELKRLGRSTGGGRDAEVQLAWVRAAAAGLSAHQRAGAAWLAARLEERVAAGYAEAAGHLAEAFPPLAAEVRRRLGVYRTEVRLDAADPTPAFSAAVATALAEAAAELERSLDRIGDAADREAIHAARIRGKRLRYLLEPVAEEAPAARLPVRRLKELQDVLGELHDAHVLAAELEAAAAAAAAERAAALLRAALDGDAEAPRRARGKRVQPGLTALARANRARRDALFTRLAEGWLDGRAASFFTAVGELAGALDAGSIATTPGTGPGATTAPRDIGEPT
jgi:CHAD domain-containing protein